MRLLLTNDDGINAPGLAVLERIAAEIAGADGEVWVVAPAFEQSGVAHCISYTHPTMLAELAPRRFAAEGTPADCVLAGIHHVMKDGPPDLVLSGVNRGNNAGENVVYSGTVGGAMEAALQGVRAIALSQYMGPVTREMDDPFEAAAAHGAGVVRSLLERGLWEAGAYMPFYNVNFPPVAAADVRGHRGGAAGIPHRRAVPGRIAGFADRADVSVVARVGAGHAAAEAGTDAAMNQDGWIAVTPLHADLTAHALLDPLRARLG